MTGNSRTKYRISACLLVGLLGSAAGPAQADVLFEIEGQGAGDRIDIWLRDGAVAMEDGQASDGTGMRYNAAQQRMRVLMHDRQQYMDVDPAMLKQTRKSVQGLSQIMGGQSEQMSNMIRQQMKAQGMSDAQIKQAMQKMQQFVQPQATAPAAREALSVRDTGERGKVANYPCRVLALSRGAQLEKRICVGDPKQMGLSAGEAQTLKSFFEFSQQMSAAAGDDGDGVGAALASGGAEGVPLEVRSANGTIESRVSRVQQGDAPPGTFDTPGTYQPGSLMPF